jgi:hypothetical protein
MQFWYQWIGLISLLCCLVISATHLVRLIRMGRPVDFARPAGSIPDGIRYSFTSGMSPVKKESAFLHLPTYFSGIVFHLGLFFTSILFIVVVFRGTAEGLPLRMALATVPLAGGITGIILLLKRVASPMLRKLSTPDDYISNVLATLLLLTAVAAVTATDYAWLFLVTGSILWCYFPLGKLKHAIYFFAARYYLGVFYGSRGVWGKNIKT